ARLFQIAALLSLLAVAIGLLWWTAVRVTPRVEQYRSASQGYTLEIPQRWQGSYRVEETATATVFLYQLPRGGEPQLVVAVEAVSPEEWAAVLDDPLRRTTSRELGQQGGMVYYAHWLANNPYRGSEARAYLTLVRGITEVLDSFKLDMAAADRQSSGGRVCIQVITPARNLATGEVKDFPTPCDVPQGWQVVSPELE
ncbi:MAG: hypothetical protein Q8P77_03450, partial [Candidatus Veblenbacteria bacterium]|nr:hypothetical protein [Candidatus Veblenbacteria bacterium]